MLTEIDCQIVSGFVGRVMASQRSLTGEIIKAQKQYVNGQHIGIFVHKDSDNSS
jgi:hypothetical protein